MIYPVLMAALPRPVRLACRRRPDVTAPPQRAASQALVFRPGLFLHRATSAVLTCACRRETSESGPQGLGRRIGTYGRFLWSFRGQGQPACPRHNGHKERQSHPQLPPSLNPPRRCHGGPLHARSSASTPVNRFLRHTLPRSRGLHRPVAPRRLALAAGPGGRPRVPELAPEGFIEPNARLWSIVIPTFNRLPILRKCLAALEAQDLSSEPLLEYEVVVVDDGSSDGTVEYLREHGHAAFPHMRLLQQQHGGAAVARNLGVQCARGRIVVFIDSDLVVTPRFLASHAASLRQAEAEYGDQRSFSYGRVVNTSNFESPESEPFKVTDLSAAFFATGNVAISRHMLRRAAALARPMADKGGQGRTCPPWAGAAGQGSDGQGGSFSAGPEVAGACPPMGVHAGDVGGGGEGPGMEEWPGGGPFDPEFRTYGWEDLELGERLRLCGARIVQCPQAVGYHWHPPFSLEHLPGTIQRERERGRNAVLFFRKHPGSVGVRLMLQLTPLHWGLWFLLTLGGHLTEKPLEPLLRAALAQGQEHLALALLSPTLNWHYMLAMRTELERSKQPQQM